MSHEREQFRNPFRPGAGHMPPYLAGREDEHSEFAKLLEQSTILENAIISGLRGVGKTVLLETFKPQARRQGWLWVGTDLSESATLSEQMIATRLLTDVSIVSSQFVRHVESKNGVEGHALDADYLTELCNATPGLMADRLQAVLRVVAEGMPDDYRGIIFAYDEAQLLSDHAERDEYPLSVLLEVFQAVQREGIPFMLLLSGLPTLFPKLIEARTYAERMFRVLFLDRLDAQASRDAVTKPIEDAGCPVHFTEDSVDRICEKSGGYPYFIQFMCREVYDVFLQAPRGGPVPSVPLGSITRKLDSDFFAGRWAKATDRQRELLWVIAQLPNHDEEFTVQEISSLSREIEAIKKFSPSHVSQMLVAMADLGLVYKNRRGRYAFAVPMLGDFILRQPSP